MAQQHFSLLRVILWASSNTKLGDKIIETEKGNEGNKICIIKLSLQNL